MKKKIFFLLLTVVVGGMSIAMGYIYGKPTTKQYPKGYNGEIFPVKQFAEEYFQYTSGVQKNGFVNTEMTKIKDPNTAIDLAKKELSKEELKEYTDISVYYDQKEKWRMVVFGDGKTNDKGVVVYMEENGVTQLITGRYKQ